MCNVKPGHERFVQAIPPPRLDTLPGITSSRRLQHLLREGPERMAVDEFHYRDQVPAKPSRRSSIEVASLQHGTLSSHNQGFNASLGDLPFENHDQTGQKFRITSTRRARRAARMLPTRTASHPLPLPTRRASMGALPASSQRHGKAMILSRPFTKGLSDPNRNTTDLDTPVKKPVRARSLRKGLSDSKLDMNDFDAPVKKPERKRSVKKGYSESSLDATSLDTPVKMPVRRKSLKKGYSDSNLDVWALDAPSEMPVRSKSKGDRLVDSEPNPFPPKKGARDLPKGLPDSNLDCTKGYSHAPVRPLLTKRTVHRSPASHQRQLITAQGFSELFVLAADYAQNPVLSNSFSSLSCDASEEDELDKAWEEATCSASTSSAQPSCSRRLPTTAAWARSKRSLLHKCHTKRLNVSRNQHETGSNTTSSTALMSSSCESMSPVPQGPSAPSAFIQKLALMMDEGMDVAETPKVRNTRVCPLSNDLT